MSQKLENVTIIHPDLLSLNSHHMYSDVGDFLFDEQTKFTF